MPPFPSSFPTLLISILNNATIQLIQLIQSDQAPFILLFGALALALLGPMVLAFWFNWEDPWGIDGWRGGGGIGAEAGTGSGTWDVERLDEAGSGSGIEKEDRDEDVVLFSGIEKNIPVCDEDMWVDW